MTIADTITVKDETDKNLVDWYYFYTPEYEIWHEHFQSRLNPIFNTIPIKLEKIDVHNQHPSHHFIGSVDRMKIVIDVIKKNLGKKIIFSDVTWVINREGVKELKEIIDNCKETTYAQNSYQKDAVNIGLICINCTVEEVELWSYCLGQIEENPNLHEQYVIDRRLNHKPMFDSQKVRACTVENAEQIQGYLALKIFTPSNCDHETRFNFRLNVIRQYGLDF
jgi:hypothetical protein